MPVQPACPQCGAALPADAPQGLCPRCLAAMNLATGTVFTEGADTLAARPPLSPSELAPHFPQLDILECLGRGGMGVVYKARQKSLNRLVALKLLAPERVTDAKFAERFAQEARALAAMNHPHIVTIHDFGQAGGFYYLLMEFVDGVNLRHLLRSRKLTPEEALAIVPPLCDALQYAHDHGMVHRDIKPENLLLDRAGRVKIADFGIAKMLGADSAGARMADTQPAGTPPYMAPEQKAAPHAVDHRADIYSLGVVFYEMLTGELPAGKLKPPSRNVRIDVRIDEIVLRALEQTPALRFQTAADLRAEVETIATLGSQPAPGKQTAMAPPEATRGFYRRWTLGKIVVVALSAMVALLLAPLVGYLVLRSYHAKEQAARALAESRWAQERAARELAIATLRSQPAGPPANTTVGPAQDGPAQTPVKPMAPSGIGVALDRQGDWIVVGRVLPNSPAAASGAIKERDIILAVGQPNAAPVEVAGMDIGNVAGMIRGPIGIPVFLTVVTPGPDMSDPRAGPAIEQDADRGPIVFPAFDPNAARTVRLVRGELDALRAWGDGHWLGTGKPAPEFSFALLPGKEKRLLSAYRGRIVVLEFWATWCGPCRQTMAELQPLMTDLMGVYSQRPSWKGKVAIITASVDENPDTASRMVEAGGWVKTAVGWSDAAAHAWVDASVMRDYHVNALPTMYIIDPDGKVAAVGHRLEVERIVNDLLTGTTPDGKGR